MKSLFLVLFLALTVPAAHARRPIVRVPGATYLYDFGAPPIALPVTRAGARAFSDARLTRYVGTLRFPQTVQASAFLPDAALVSGLARQGRISAWVRLTDLGPLPDRFFEDLREAEKRRAAVETLIARNDVAVGMTMDEVRRSLGRPQRTTQSVDRGASRTVWEYVRYRTVPQTVLAPQPVRVTHLPGRGAITTGGTFVQPATQWVRVPVGRTTVTFENGLAVAITQSEDHPPAGRPRVVAPPLQRVF